MSSHIESSTLPSYHSQYVSGGKNLPFHAGLNPDTILLTETDTIDLGSHQVNSTAKRLSDATQETGASTAKVCLPVHSWLEAKLTKRLARCVLEINYFSVCGDGPNFVYI